MANEYTIDTYLNRGGNHNMYGMTEDMVNRTYGDIVPQAMSNNLPYQAGTLVDAPLSAGMIPPWVLAAGSIGYLGGKYDVFGKAKDAVGNWIDGFRGTSGIEETAMDTGLQTALDDNGYPVITEGPYAGKNRYMVRRGIQDLHGTGPMTQHQEGTTYPSWETQEEDTLRAAYDAEQKRLLGVPLTMPQNLDDEFYAQNQDTRRGPLQAKFSREVLDAMATGDDAYFQQDNRTEWQKWTDSFKRDWQAR